MFDSKAQALQFRNQLLSGRFDTQADQATVDNRRLNELIQLWYDLHGRSLKSSSKTMKKLLRLSGFIGNPVAKLIKPDTVASYRAGRLDSGILPATLNRELITLKAVFRELKRLSVIDYESSVLSVRGIREAKPNSLI